jgi:hypothetical protein
MAHSPTDTPSDRVRPDVEIFRSEAADRSRRPGAMLLLTLVGRSTIGPRREHAALPRLRDISTRYRAYTDWDRTLLDTIYRLPLSYKPPGMADTSQAGFSSGHLVRHRLIDDLRALGTAARAVGARLDIQSAFRSSAAQAATFNYWVSVFGYATALHGSARPGHPRVWLWRYGSEQ